MKDPAPLSRICYCLIVFCLSAQFSLAQKRKSAILKFDHTAHEGIVLLNDGTEVSGDIVFNDNDGIVTVYVGDESQSFNARRFVRFEYYDEGAGRRKRFYSLEFDDPETGLRDMQIFEVLKELPSFAVLCRIDRVKTEARRGILEPQGSPLLVDRKNKKFTQTETVYFVSNEGEFRPYLRWVKKEFDGDLLDYNESNTWVLDPGLLEKYTGLHYGTLEEYARANKLKFRRKPDLIKLLDEYALILQN